MERESEIIGAVGLAAMSIRPGDSAVAMGIGDLPIAAVSHLVNLRESAAITAVGAFLEAGERTRMTTLNLGVLGAVSFGTDLWSAAPVCEF